MKRIVRKALMMLSLTMMFSMLANISLYAEENDYGYADGYAMYPVDEMRFNVQKDNILVSAYYQGTPYMYEPIKYCMYAYDQQLAQWSLVGGWQDSNTFVWEPDANDIYTLVIYAGRVRRDGSIYQVASRWQEVSRPQMGIQVTGDCAMPTSEGLLYGCTSNIDPNNADAGNYFTTCYIWSHDRQAWITQSSYRAWGSAWYRTATLPKGLYMMYNCTEKLMPNGQKRKLSCHYYLFNLS